MTVVNLNEWYFFEGDTIDKKTCNKIRGWAKDKWIPSAVDTSKSVTDEERKIGKKPDYKPNTKMRISDVAFCNEQWLYDLIFPFMQRANYEAGWRYDVPNAESSQITRYKKGEFYNFHTDGKGDHMSAYARPENKFLHGKVRKLSVTLTLNDEYEGNTFRILLATIIYLSSVNIFNESLATGTGSERVSPNGSISNDTFSLLSSHKTVVA